MLSVIDRRWRDHLYEMDYLKDGIGLRAMAQRDPLVEYQREGFAMFQSMMGQIREEAVGFLFNLEVEVTGGAEVQARGLTEEQNLQLSYTAPSEDADGGVEVRDERGRVDQGATARGGAARRGFSRPRRSRTASRRLSSRGTRRVRSAHRRARAGQSCRTPCRGSSEEVGRAGRGLAARGDSWRGPGRRRSEHGEVCRSPAAVDPDEPHRDGAGARGGVDDDDRLDGVIGRCVDPARSERDRRHGGPAALRLTRAGGDDRTKDEAGVGLRLEPAAHLLRIPRARHDLDRAARELRMSGRGSGSAVAGVRCRMNSSSMTASLDLRRRGPSLASACSNACAFALRCPIPAS